MDYKGNDCPKAIYFKENAARQPHGEACRCRTAAFLDQKNGVPDFCKGALNISKKELWKTKRGSFLPPPLLYLIVPRAIISPAPPEGWAASLPGPTSRAAVHPITSRMVNRLLSAAPQA